ncbi:MAG: hypothetical protein MZV63_04295 [Marinilabiliales bacterium]|nr:hypothetical protein [Marinilabiliales bacterium]
MDEVGSSIISENTKLMLNLQTIAETLAVKTRGASWVLGNLTKEDIGARGGRYEQNPAE